MMAARAVSLQIGAVSLQIHGARVRLAYRFSGP